MKFKKGDVLKIMPVEGYSHVKQPYYVQVIEAGEYSMTTHIPGTNNTHIRTFDFSRPEWEHYHKKRITNMGQMVDPERVLARQSLK